jgi:hypothetical protein
MTPGTKLGPYEILAAIGAGGMGEVYRAHDPKLGRDVAIKVLPEAFARDAERMARFQREAKVLAMAVDVNTSGVFQAGVPKALFKVPAGELFWDVSSDGKRFIMAAPSANASAPPKFTVVLNWQAGLKK